MPAKCFVPGCCTKVRLFKASEHFKKRWENLNVIRDDKELKIGDSVCYKHFEDRYVVKNNEIIRNGETVLLPRCNWKLKDDAVPTIFPRLSTEKMLKLAEYFNTPKGKKDESTSDQDGIEAPNENSENISLNANEALLQSNIEKPASKETTSTASPPSIIFTKTCEVTEHTESVESNQDQDLDAQDYTYENNSLNTNNETSFDELPNIEIPLDLVQNALIGSLSESSEVQSIESTHVDLDYDLQNEKISRPNDSNIPLNTLVNETSFFQPPNIEIPVQFETITSSVSSSQIFVTNSETAESTLQYLETPLSESNEIFVVSSSEQTELAESTNVPDLDEEAPLNENASENILLNTDGTISFYQIHPDTEIPMELENIESYVSCTSPSLIEQTAEKSIDQDLETPNNNSNTENIPVNPNGTSLYNQPYTSYNEIPIGETIKTDQSTAHDLEALNQNPAEIIKVTFAPGVIRIQTPKNLLSQSTNQNLASSNKNSENNPKNGTSAASSSESFISGLRSKHRAKKPPGNPRSKTLLYARITSRDLMKLREKCYELQRNDKIKNSKIDKLLQENNRLRKQLREAKDNLKKTYLCKICQKKEDMIKTFLNVKPN